MNPEQWTAIDRYITDLLVPPDPALDQALRDSAQAGLPAINVSPNQGKLLHLLAKITGARNILEVGTLGGYSTIWLARGMARPGKLITLEADEKHAQVARANIARAGLSDVVEIILAPALQTIPRLASEKRGPFDLIFIDADKPNNPAYFDWAVKLSRPGSLIIVDNVVRKGAIIDQANVDPAIAATRKLFEVIAKDSRVTATAIQTVGSKGHDGFAIMIVK